MYIMAKQEILLDSVVVRNDKSYLASAVGDELVMMGIESGTYVGMNSVGSVIWGLLEQPIAVNELVYRLTELYEVPREVCEKQVLGYLQKINEQEMLTEIR
jgi:hypothetical protein